MRESAQRTHSLIALVVVLINTTFVFVFAESQHVTGLCCPAEGGSGGLGCPGVAAGDITPPIWPDNYTETITWRTQPLSCPPASTLAYYKLNNTNNYFTVEENELALVYRLGELLDKSTLDYCLEDDGAEYRVAVCQPDREQTCGGAVCIPKCCGKGEVIYIENYNCTAEGYESAPKFYSPSGEPIPPPAKYETVGDSVPECPEGWFQSTIMDNINVLVNGKLLDSKGQHPVTLDFDQYCLDDVYDIDGEVTQWAVVCIEEESSLMLVKHKMMQVGYIISDVFLITTILFHVFIPSLRDAQGLILVSHMASMLVALTLLFVLHVTPTSMSTAVCIFCGFMFQFSFVAMFFWLNVMCFDIWRVVRATAKGIPLAGILSNDSKKFLVYCVYGWGCPLLITLVTATLQFLPHHLTEGITRPGIGVAKCFVPGYEEEWIYLYVYVASLFILDLVFIGHTVLMLYQAGSAFRCFARQVSVTAFNRTHLEAFWQRFGVFVMMVFCWSTEVISHVFHPQAVIWIVTDFTNSLQGFILFLIFVSSKKRRDLVKKLVKKATSCLPRVHANETINNFVATWNPNSPSSSTSGPSGPTEASSLTTDGKDTSDTSNKAMQ